MRTIPSVARTQWGVFTVDQAYESGWTSHALRHAVAAGTLIRLRCGVYAAAPIAEADRYRARLLHARQLAMAFALTNPTVPLSHASAGALLGLTLTSTHGDEVCATFARGRRGPMPGVHRHRGRLGAGHVQRCGPALITRPARTVVDLGHELGPDAAIAAADSALRQRLASVDEFDAVMAETGLWPGIRPIHRAVTLADGRAESALESISRLRLMSSGLPTPQLQTVMRGAGGRFLGRSDFYWDGPGVVGEADGIGKYDDKIVALRDEKRRQSGLERAGLIVVRWGWDDLADFSAVTAELASAFARGMRPDRAARMWRVEDAWPHRIAAS